MKFTIITASYNSISTIERTIISVLKQKYKNIEYIVIDGGSVDGTVEIINKYKDKIAYFCSESDQGVYNAFNKGLEKSTGDYIMFLGSDDWLVNDDVINDVRKDIIANYGFDAYGFPIYKVDSEQKIQIKIVKKPIKTEIEQGEMIAHQGLFVNGDIMRKLKFNENYKIAGDYDFLLRFIKKNYSIYYGEIITTFFSLGGLSSNKKYIDCLHQEQLKILEANGCDSYLYKNKILKEKSFINIEKNRLRKICKNIGILKSLLKMKGWHNHVCNNRYCWCGGRKEN